MNDIQQTFTLPGSSPLIISWGDPARDIMQATVGSAPLTTGGTITFQYPPARAPASYLGSSFLVAEMFVRAIQASFTQETDFTLSFGASNITLTYLAQPIIPAGAILNLQIPVTDTSGQATVAGHALPVHAVDPNLGL